MGTFTPPIILKASAKKYAGFLGARKQSSFCVRWGAYENLGLLLPELATRMGRIVLEYICPYSVLLEAVLWRFPELCTPEGILFPSMDGFACALPLSIFTRSKKFALMQ